MSAGPGLSWRKGWLACGLVVVTALAVGACVEPDEEKDPSQYFTSGTTTGVSSPIEFTDEPYDFSGETTIEDLRGLIPESENVWHGFAEGMPYPVAGDCDPERDWDTTEPAYFDELPTTIEGVVTLHPRYFMKISICGTEERYYGSYIIQDETTGIHVMKDSRVAEFDVGDRVRLTVTGISRNFQTFSVLAFSEEEVLTTPATREPVYFEAIDRPFDDSQDMYEVRRIRGRVVLEATNQNFNEMVVQSEDDEEVDWFVSLDRELGTRGVAPKQGALVELTGPVIDSFGLRMVIGSLGLIDVIEEP